jgi:hypothetical protein
VPLDHAAKQEVAWEIESKASSPAGTTMVSDPKVLPAFSRYFVDFF